MKLKSELKVDFASLCKMHRSKSPVGTKLNEELYLPRHHTPPEKIYIRWVVPQRLVVLPDGALGDFYCVAKG